MISGVFRGKESSNRIELSRLVQELLNFDDLGSLWLWGMGVSGWEWGMVWGCPHTCAHACVCTHTHTHTHACMVNMIISCKWPPPLGESLGISYDVIHACICMYVFMCVGASFHHPHPHPPTPPTPGGTPRISKNSIALEVIKIFQFCLWRLPHPWVGV